MFPIRNTIPSKSFPIITWLLILLNVLIFLFQKSLDEKAFMDFIHRFALVPSEIQNQESILGTFLPFLTNMFLHGSLLHLISNVWTLAIFGDNVEDRMGRGRYILFYLLCGFLAGATHYFLNLHVSLPALGASGAIAGIMGAYMLAFPQSKIVFLVPILFIPFFFKISAYLYLAIWFSIQFLSLAVNEIINLTAGVAYGAHIGGFIAGLLFYGFFTQANRDPIGSDHLHNFERNC